MQEITIKNRKKGVLLPARSKEKKKRKNKIKKEEYNISLLSIFKNNGYKKKLKIPNLNMKEPAIHSSPKGPDNLLGTPS